MTDGCPALLVTLGNHLRRSGRILSLHILQLRMLSQELTALHEGNGMRVYLGNRVPVILRQTADAVGNMQLVLTDHRCPRVAQQLVVMQQRACNRILDSEHTNSRGILLDIVKDLFEG